GIVFTVSLVALATLLQLWRTADHVATNSIWAEDGVIVLSDSLNLSFLDAIFTPYAGYLILVPRLIGEVAMLFPLQDAALAISLTSALAASLAGLAVWFAAAAYVDGP